MINPVEFYVSMNQGLVAPLVGAFQWILPVTIVGALLWQIATRTIVARPDLLLAAAVRSLLLTVLLWAWPFITPIIDYGWATSYSAGTHFVKDQMNALMERYGTIYDIAGLAVGSVGAQAAKNASKVFASDRARKIIEREGEKIAAELAKKGQLTKENFKKEMQEFAKNNPKLIEQAKYAPDIAPISNRIYDQVKTTLQYANIVGIFVYPILWLFAILGMATGLAVALAKLAIPIALFTMAISPRSGANALSHVINVVVSASATALLVPLIVGFGLHYFIGGPSQEVLDAWTALQAPMGVREFIGKVLGLVFTFVVSMFKLAVGMFFLYLLGALAASSVPYIIGRAFISTGLLETFLLGRALSGVRLPGLKPIKTPEVKPNSPLPGGTTVQARPVHTPLPPGGHHQLPPGHAPAGGPPDRPPALTGPRTDGGGGSGGAASFGPPPKVITVEPRPVEVEVRPAPPAKGTTSKP